MFLDMYEKTCKNVSSIWKLWRIRLIWSFYCHCTLCQFNIFRFLDSAAKYQGKIRSLMHLSIIWLAPALVTQTIIDSEAANSTFYSLMWHSYKWELFMKGIIHPQSTTLPTKLTLLLREIRLIPWLYFYNSVIVHLLKINRQWSEKVLNAVRFKTPLRQNLNCSAYSRSQLLPDPTAFEFPLQPRGDTNIVGNTLM